MQTKTLIWWWSTRRGKSKSNIFVHELLQSFHYIQFLLSPVIHVLTLDRASSTAEYRFASVSLSEESDEMSAWSTTVLLDGSLCSASVTDVDGSLFWTDSTWLGGSECLAGDPTSIWKSSASAACFLFLVGGFYWGSGDCIWSIQSINVHHIDVHCNLMQACTRWNTHLLSAWSWSFLIGLFTGACFSWLALSWAFCPWGVVVVLFFVAFTSWVQHLWKQVAFQLLHLSKAPYTCGVYI